MTPPRGSGAAIPRSATRSSSAPDEAATHWYAVHATRERLCGAPGATPKSLPRIVAEGIGVHHLSLERPSLEERYLDITDAMEVSA